MATAAIDFSEFRVTLEEVLERIKGRIRGSGFPELDEPEAVFNEIAEAFDNYREAFVRGDAGDDALLELAATTILMKGQG